MSVKVQGPGTGHDLRVGIIGAGCAGLAAAEELRALGYRRVTILEARARAGGQCVSETTEDADGRPVIYD
ncbi:MAG TPA: NAD(P)-binding protein, partial [Nannocystis sp.]